MESFPHYFITGPEGQSLSSSNILGQDIRTFSVRFGLDIQVPQWITPSGFRYLFSFNTFRLRLPLIDKVPSQGIFETIWEISLKFSGRGLFRDPSGWKPLTFQVVPLLGYSLNFQPGFRPLNHHPHLPPIYSAIQVNLMVLSLLGCFSLDKQSADRSLKTSLRTGTSFVPDPEKKPHLLVAVTKINRPKIATSANETSAVLRIILSQHTEITTVKLRCFLFLIIKNVNFYWSLYVENGCGRSDKSLTANWLAWSR